jgi:predicted small secreted protein
MRGSACKLAAPIGARDRLSAEAVPARGQVLAAAMMAIVLTATEGSIVTTPARELLQIRAVCSIGFDQWFLEVPMRKQQGLAGLLLVVLMLMGAGSILSACGTVAGAGQDVSTVGNAVTSGAEQTRRATGLP